MVIVIGDTEEPATPSNKKVQQSVWTLTGLHNTVIPSRMWRFFLKRWYILGLGTKTNHYKWTEWTRMRPIFKKKNVWHTRENCQKTTKAENKNKPLVLWKIRQWALLKQLHLRLERSIWQAPTNGLESKHGENLQYQMTNSNLLFSIHRTLEPLKSLNQ